jgi:very-short-patch-repair endonuclease
MNKEKYLQIFNYLKEFSKLRSKPTRDISVEETQYPEKFWLSDILENDLFDNIIRPNFNEDNDYWLKVRKPKEPSIPEFAKLSEDLENWIEKPTLLIEENKPELKQILEINGKTLHVEDFPNLDQKLKLYIEKKWNDDLIEYKEKLKNYEIQSEEYEKLNSVYKNLFRIFNKTQQLGEEYELVVGVGLLNFKENEEFPKIFRHVFTQSVDINFEFTQNDSQILISLNLGSSPQIETDSIIDLVGQFETQNLIEAETCAKDLIIAKEIDSIFNKDIHEAIGSFSQRFCPEKDSDYDETIEKPLVSDNKPKVYYAPCLILRKRNTQNFTALYDKILQNINESEDGLEIPSINDLIGVQQNIEDDNFLNVDNNNNTIEPVFFPKEYNDEQLEIVEKLKKNNKILVQGPPGTGKSHTIANLICHLLANGKKVLVTAYTKRSLEVLKDKLPNEFQNLAVSLLSGDSSSIQDLESSVNSINEELSRANLSDYQTQITVLENLFKNIKESIAESTNRLINIKEKATRKQEINENYNGTLTEIALNIERDSPHFDWYKDDFCDIHNDELMSKLLDFIQLYENYKHVEVEEFDYDIPDTNKLISSNQLKDYLVLNLSLENDSFSKDSNLIVLSSDFEQLIQLLTNLQNIYKEADGFQIDFTTSIIESFLKGKNQVWIEAVYLSNLALNKLEKYDLAKINKDVEVTYSHDKSIKQLKNDAQTLLNYLDQGNSLSGFNFLLKKPFLPKEIKERLYFIDSVRVNGSPCDTIEEYRLVLQDILIQQELIELSEIWNNKTTLNNTFFKSFLLFKQIHDEVQRLIKLIDDAKVLKSKIESISNLRITIFDKENIEVSIQKANYSRIVENISLIKDSMKYSKDYLKNRDFHPIKDKILEAYDQIDYQIYSELLNKLSVLSNGKQDFLNFNNLRSEIIKSLPFIIKSIEESSFSANDIKNLKHAILFKDAQAQVKNLLDVDAEKKLIEIIKDLESKERKTIAKLAAKKAWYKVVERLDKNRTLKQHLVAWVLAVKTLGKTGKGKKAMKFRKIAQQEMEHCKDSIPCWIMPLYKVVETIQPKQEMYDYVIIDEASQLGPDAIFLLYITKNIIIVGDDKQTSPEYVGVDVNIMTPHIKRHLYGIPYSAYYGTEFSFFDHAKLFCDGVTVLREHFRCMPEIIEFSNKYFYAPEGKGLYPLKQYSENRLEPLETVFCNNGYTEGIGARIINQPEAVQIVDKIGNLIDDDNYKGKSIGVITLQGNQQASLIENLLLKRIGEKEFYIRKIVCGNSSSFQGDERDIIFLSLVTAHNHKRAPLVRAEDERRFNVAVSRAKEQIWLFHSVQIDDLSNTNDLRYKLLDHFSNYNSYQPIFNQPFERANGAQPEPFDSWFEVDVYNEIIKRQLSVIPQYEVAGGKYRIDMVALLPDGTKIAIECDGDRWHGPEQYQNDIMRQNVLERCGWQFFRIRGYEFYTDRVRALEPLWKMISVFKDKEPIKDFNKHELTKDDEIIEELPDVIQNQPENLDVINEEVKYDNFEQNNSGSETYKILRYFNLYKSGTYILTEKEALAADYIVPIQEIHRYGFVLQCYKSGHINKVHVSVLLSKKINKEYMNGLNFDDELIDIQIIDSEKIIGIYFNEGGIDKFKAHLSENISTRNQLGLLGYKVIYDDFEKVKYSIFPLKIHFSIRRLVFNSFTANGKPIDNNYYENEWSIIKQYSKLHEIKKIESEVNIPKLNLENKVSLNNIVKIKFVNNNKELLVKLVDRQTNGVEIINGVQIVNIMKPIAASIKGKSIGEKVMIDGTNNEIEILEII